MSTVTGYGDDDFDRKFDALRNDPMPQPKIHPLEYLDYIPFVSIITGFTRAIFGVLEVIFGVLILPIQLFSKVTMGVYGRPHIIEGTANIVRGAIAMKPILGNIILYLYDHSIVFKRDLRRSAGLE